MPGIGPIGESRTGRPARDGAGASRRVGVIGLSGSDDFATNVASGLDQMGHVSVDLGSAAPAPKGRALATIYRTTVNATPPILEAWQRRIVAKAYAADLDAIVSVDARLQPSIIRKLKAAAPIALWFPDHVANLGSQVMLACSYDALFFKDRGLVCRLRGLTDLPLYYLPEACNPAWHRPGPRMPIDPVIVVAGNLYPSRALLLEKLHHAGIPLQLYSSRWARSLSGLTVQRLPIRPEVRGETKAVVFRRAAAVLNNMHPAEEGMNCRLFEAAGCGAVVLCEDRPVLGEFFSRDTDLLVFSNFDNLVDCARWALGNPGLGTSIGDAAAQHAHADHTYQQRLTHVLKALNVVC